MNIVTRHSSSNFQPARRKEAKKPHTGTGRWGRANTGAKAFPPFVLDPGNQCLWRNRDAEENERVLLTPKAFSVLTHLVERAGHLVTQDELLDAVWPDAFVQPEVLKYQIADIRSALGDNPKDPVFIETLPRRGYQFIAPVKHTGATGITLPAMYARPHDGELVGRDSEIQALHDSFARTLHGQRQIVFITGEPGIGKTALVDEFLRQAALDQPLLRIARGPCVEGYGGAEPYYPMLEALGQLCRVPGGDRAVEILAAHAPTWLVQFPALMNREHRQMLQQEILGATRDRMLREIREALDMIAGDSPLILTLENLHWVDSSTIDLISAIARQRSAGKIMLILTKRTLDIVVPEHPLKALKRDLLVHHLCQELSLAPLSEPDIAEYLSAGSPGGNIPDGFAELIHRHCDGNPLFMIAALDHMTERGLIARGNGHWKLLVPLGTIDLEVPETLRQMIEAQIDHLTTDEQRVLEVASVAGVRFSSHVIAPAMKMDAEHLEEIFWRLCRRARLLRPIAEHWSCGTAGFEFVHAMYREVLYRRQTLARRTAIQDRIGERLQRQIDAAAAFA